MAIWLTLEEYRSVGSMEAFLAPPKTGDKTHIEHHRLLLAGIIISGPMLGADIYQRTESGWTIQGDINGSLELTHQQLIDNFDSLMNYYPRSIAISQGGINQSSPDDFEVGQSFQHVVFSILPQELMVINSSIDDLRSRLAALEAKNPE